MNAPTSALLKSQSECSELQILQNINPQGSSTAAYPADTSPVLNRLLKQFSQEGEPISVSFRELVPWMKVGERATHYIHAYPAKLLPQIAHFFLAAKALSSDTVLDPFGGTGTVALEAILAGKRAYYADANPLARLIASVKTTRIDIDQARATFNLIHSTYKRVRPSTHPDVVNIDLWFDPKIIRQLCRIKAAIENEAPQSLAEFFLITFSMTVRKVSNADPRFSVPVRWRKSAPATQQPDAWQAFADQFHANCRRQAALSSFIATEGEAFCVGNDARQLKSPSNWKDLATTALPNDCVDLIITSPPYAGAQKYVRAASLSLGWLGLTKSSELRILEGKTIGREHFSKAERESFSTTAIAEADRVLRIVYEKNKTRAAIASTYLNEMREAIAEMHRVCRPGGHAILVIGNNDICGEIFDSASHLTRIFEDAGFKTTLKLVDTIKSRGLMTKRNRTASVITREWVILFEKPTTPHERT